MALISGSPASLPSLERRPCRLSRLPKQEVILPPHRSSPHRLQERGRVSDFKLSSRRIVTAAWMVWLLVAGSRGWAAVLEHLEKVCSRLRGGGALALPRFLPSASSAGKPGCARYILVVIPDTIRACDLAWHAVVCGQFSASSIFEKPQVG